MDFVNPVSARAVRVLDRTHRKVDIESLGTNWPVVRHVEQIERQDPSLPDAGVVYLCLFRVSHGRIRSQLQVVYSSTKEAENETNGQYTEEIVRRSFSESG
jgi:hypothetical protein